MCKGCHVVTVALRVRDLEVLEAACKRLNWQFHLGNKGFRWYGSWQDDSPVPEDIFNRLEYEHVQRMTREERCAYMTQFVSRPQAKIGVPGMDYNVGVYRVEGEYRLFYDNWKGDFDRGPLLQAFAIEQAKATARQQGQTFYERELADGTIQLHVHCQE
jgi:hypothetical protein